jgi:siroheme synthase
MGMKILRLQKLIEYGKNQETPVMVAVATTSQANYIVGTLGDIHLKTAENARTVLVLPSF